MKRTTKSIQQKILIVLTTLIMLTFSVVKPVQADFGGILVSPITSLLTSIVDSVQWLLEWAMLGESNYFMDESLEDHISETPTGGATNIQITKEKYGKIDGAFLGIDAANIPSIQYTPEAIFSNRVSSLDINFVKPSVHASKNATEEQKEKLEERSSALNLQPVIASWYTAMRTLAVVGLLSVLVYLGIRMMFSGIAADKAKYKKMMMDWVVAVCLIFALHYIMSLALTAAETVTALISKSIGNEFFVTVESDVYGGSGPITFKTNLTNYVRFMVQSTDFRIKLSFFALYLMLVIYNVRFTWIYLKRVVNMAFLTLIAPLVALTYPIDKVGDGKAQAFSLWIKEYTFNALLQPLHLLLYIVLLGSATTLAATNPLYAIVCLGFILAGEKLLKKMFGFDKAGAGTVGSLAGAAGVSAMASQALMRLAKKPQEGGSGGGKIRTNDRYQRDGKNQNANKDYKSFNRPGNNGIPMPDEINSPSGDNGAPPLPSGGNDTSSLSKEEQDELAGLQNYFDNTDNNDAYMNPELYQANLDRMKELEEARDANNVGPDTSGSPNPGMTEDALEGLRNDKIRLADLPDENEKNEPETWRDLRDRDIEEKARQKRLKSLEPKWYDDIVQAGHKNGLGGAMGVIGDRASDLKRRAGISAYKTIRGLKAAAPQMAYSAARGTLKTAGKVAMGAALAGVAGVIGATTGDGEKAIGAALTAAGVGVASGGSIFESTVGSIMPEKSLSEAYGTGKYGSSIDYRNEKADKAYLRSKAHQEEYEKYFKSSMTKKEFNEATKSYRESGITDTKTIRKALKLEQEYLKSGGNKQDVRANVQNIAQTYDSIEKAAFRNKEAKEATLKNIEAQLTKISDEKQRRSVANQIFQGYVDWRNA